MSSAQLSRAVFELLVGSGLEHVVLCPGSRSAPLAFAASSFDRGGVLTLHTRIDERTAGFLALGLARGSRRPVAVVCTSGTAVANLHPAMLEAAHSGLPLVAITADRPASLRGTNANQTTEQVGIFGDAVPCWDIENRGDLRDLVLPDGPVQLNVQLKEPLVPREGWAVVGVGADEPHDAPRRRWAEHPDAVHLSPGPRTVVVAGDSAGPAARGLAERASWPLLAEPSSGSRTGANPIRAYRLLLDGELGRQVERVVVLGHPTLSRPVAQLLATVPEVYSVPAYGRWPDLPTPVTATAAAYAAAADDPAWLELWRTADRDLSRRLDALVDEQGLGPHVVAREVSAAVPPGGSLFVGASNPVRDLDLMATTYPVGERRRVLANRGLAGIDGSVSSAIGAAITRPGQRNLALLGDVTFLHDATALVIGPDEPRPDLTVVVVNDDGGSIFATLEQGDPSYADRFERLFGTPHGVDLAALCAATGTPHWRVGSVPELRQALASPNGGIDVVEVRVRRDDRRALDEQIRALVTRAQPR